MADAFVDEVDAEPTITIGDYLKAVDEEELFNFFAPIHCVSFIPEVRLLKVSRGPRSLTVLMPEIPRDEGEPLYEDFICQGCAVACSFLAWYPKTILAPDQLDIKENPMPVNLEKGKKCIDDTLSTINSTTVPVGADAEGILKKHSAVGGSSTKCILGDLFTNSALTCNNKPLFLAKNWRSALCSCEKCSNYYSEKGLSFLLDKDDSLAKQKRDENMQKQEGAELNFLNNLGHVEKIELLSGIADMKNEIASFLESSGPSKVITAADIQQVFENLAKKRKRLD